MTGVGDALGPILIMRGIERLVAVGIAGMSIFLGWSLFSRTLDAPVGEASASGMGWKLTVKRVGPGTFFALFGAAIVSFSLFQPISGETLTSSGQTPDSRTATTRLDVVSGFGGSAESTEPLRLVHAYNTMLDLASADVSDPVVLRAKLGDLKRVAPELRKSRDKLVVAQFGPSAFNLWTEKGHLLAEDPARLSPEERGTLQVIAHWMNDRLSSD